MSCFDAIKLRLIWFYQGSSLAHEHKMNQNEQVIKYGWCGRDFVKNTFRSSIFKNNTIYTISVPLSFKNSLLKQKIFVLFFRP
jgi:hypothetical protein